MKNNGNSEIKLNSICSIYTNVAIFINGLNIASIWRLSWAIYGPCTQLLRGYFEQVDDCAYSMFNISTLQNIPVLMKDTRRIRCCHTFVHVRPLIHIKCDIKKVLIGCILRLVTFHHLDYDMIIRFFWIMIIFPRMDLKSSKSGRFGATIKWNARNSIHNKLWGVA